MLGVFECVCVREMVYIYILPLVIGCKNSMFSVKSLFALYSVVDCSGYRSVDYACGANVGGAEE